MGKVLDIKIDPDIVLDEKRLVNSTGKRMPEPIIQNVLITMTIAAERYDCDWRELTWNVRFNEERMPVISVKRKTQAVKVLTIWQKLLRLFGKK